MKTEGGLKCSRCSETAVFHGDVPITDPQTLSSVSSVFTGLVIIKVNHSLFSRSKRLKSPQTVT